MAEPDNSELVQRWRQLFKRYNSPNLGLTEKATLLREMLSEIDFHRKLGRISQQCYDALSKKYTKEYARISQSNVGKENDVLPVSNIRTVGQQSGNGEISVKTKESQPSTDRIVETSKSENVLVDSHSTAQPAASISSQEITRPIVIDRKTHEPEVVIEKVRKMEMKPKADQSLLNLWSCARKTTNDETKLVSRPDKRKYQSESPVSKKAAKSEPDERPPYEFLTAADQLRINQMKKNGGRAPPSRSSEPIARGEPPDIPQYGKMQKSLGTRRGLSSKFIPPVPNQGNNTQSNSGTSSTKDAKDDDKYSDPIYQDDRLKNCEPRMIELILNEILDSGRPMSWDDIAGLEFAKKTIQEIVVWPMLRPDIFTGLRGPPKGLLLFGPPGTGKTLIGKCIASQSNSTFFTISASSLTSKWVGEGEKMVRTLFAVARCHQPAVVFIDEIDSLLSQRSDQEHESSRRIKTEFLVQLDGACTASDERLLVIGATNRPQEIDEAARRRFVKRLYIPLPERAARCQIVQNLVKDQKYEITPSQLEEIGQQTDGYSGSDMANLCREAALGPIRSIPFDQIHSIAADDVRPIQHGDFLDALEQVKASVSDKDLDLYVEWNSKFGSGKR